MRKTALRKPRVKPLKIPSHLERCFMHIIEANKLSFLPEYRFHPVRRWKFDFADVKNMVAVELEGGIWIGGRHNRGSGYQKDTEKYNRATTMGWRVLRYCSREDIINQFLSDYQDILNLQNGKTIQ